MFQGYLCPLPEPPTLGESWGSARGDAKSVRYNEAIPVGHRGQGGALNVDWFFPA
jgi:hypothetical protein